MKPFRRIPLHMVQPAPNGGSALFLPAFSSPTTVHRACVPRRFIQQSTQKPANVAPIVGTGPPPEPPVPEAAAATPYGERVARRRRQAELLKRAKEVRSAAGAKNAGSSKGSAPLKRRFWAEVSVKEVDGALQVHLDSRPLRHPKTKEIVRLPLTKPNLATALAIEWDHLTSSQDATRHHLVPLTSLVCRGLDIQSDDQAHTPNQTAPLAPIRASIVTTVLRYLDTDSLLCWAPEAGPHDLRNDAGESLRDVQKQTAEEVVGFLATHVWPGVVIEPVLDGESIVPRRQAEGVREVLQGWVAGLSAWELAGLERAVLAGKSFVAAVRLVVEWSEDGVGVRSGEEKAKFGVEEVAKATSLEVDWQTGQWGEVEDTHDVEKEDSRRQFGGVVLLVSGTGAGKQQ